MHFIACWSYNIENSCDISKLCVTSLNLSAGENCGIMIQIIEINYEFSIFSCLGHHSEVSTSSFFYKVKPKRNHNFINRRIFLKQLLLWHILTIKRRWLFILFQEIFSCWWRIWKKKRFKYFFPFDWKSHLSNEVTNKQP